MASFTEQFSVKDKPHLKRFFSKDISFKDTRISLKDVTSKMMLSSLRKDHIKKMSLLSLTAKKRRIKIMSLPSLTERMSLQKNVALKSPQKDDSLSVGGETLVRG